MTLGTLIYFNVLSKLDDGPESMANNHLKALNLAREGHWDAAHELVQSASDELACLIHAYLHREEGDLGNAAYWYHRAGVNMPDNTLDDELARLTRLAEKDG